MRPWLVVGVVLALVATPISASAATAPPRTILVLTNTADAPEVEAGATAGFVLTVRNAGPRIGIAVALRDRLPTLPGLSWVMSAGAPGCVIRDGRLGCFRLFLRAGQTMSVHVITPTTPQSCGVLSNTATVTAIDAVSTTVGPVTSVLHCKAFPTMKTAASPKIGVPGKGSAVFDTATLSGCAGNVCTGNVTFTLVGPNSCSTVALGPATFAVANNAAKAVGITGVLPIGDYYWITTYSGDQNNNPISPAVGCGDPDELFQQPPPNSPTISSVTSPHSAPLGQVVATESVFLSGCYNLFCTGNIIVTLVGPNSCSTIAAGPATFPVNGNSISTPSILGLNAPGNYYWTASYSGDAQNNPVSPAVGCGDGNELIHVGAATQISTASSPQVVSAGQQVSLKDTGTLNGCFNNSCTGTITFQLLGPNSCQAVALGPFTVGVNANAASVQASWTPNSVGNYYWSTTYSGDLNNLAASGQCQDFAELVHVSPASKPTPTVGSVASPQTGTVGQGMAVFDTATLTGCFNNACSGTVTMAIVGPNSCSTVALGPVTFALANNTYKATGIWTPPAGGDYYWITTYNGDFDNNAVGPVGCGDGQELIHVPTPPPPPPPNLIALALNGVISVGVSTPLQDNATLSGCADNVCTGTITFTLVGPNSCDTVAMGPITAGVDADAASANTDWTPTASGDYFWTASYSGDGANNAVSPAIGCGDPLQLVHVSDGTAP